MAEHSRAVHVMASMLNILHLGDQAVAMTDRLAELYKEHHQLMIELYSIRNVKPKSHMTYHIPENLRDFGVNLSCFSCERRLRLVKGACLHAARLPIGPRARSVMNRLLLDLENRLSQSQCRCYALCSPSHEDRCLVTAWPPRDRPSTVLVSKGLHWPRGVLKAGHIISAQVASYGGVFFSRLRLP